MALFRVLLPAAAVVLRIVSGIVGVTSLASHHWATSVQGHVLGLWTVCVKQSRDEDVSCYETIGIEQLGQCSILDRISFSGKPVSDSEYMNILILHCIGVMHVTPKITPTQRGNGI